MKDVEELLEQHCRFKIGQVVRFKIEKRCEGVVLTRSFIQGLSGGVAIKYLVSNSVQKEHREVYEQEIEVSGSETA